MPSIRDPRKAQSGATLVELLVSVAIIGIALMLVVGTVSTGLLNSTLAKRNTSAEAVVQYEMDSIAATSYDSSPAPYSDCFTTQSATAPLQVALGGSCPQSAAFRADVTVSSLPSAWSVQVWTISLISLPDGAQVGSPLSVYKAPHR